MSFSFTKTQSLLAEYSEAHGTSGHEDAVQKIFVRTMQGRQCTTDGLGSVIATRPGATGPRVVLTAHMDEVGFLVQEVTDQGYLRLAPLGGWPDGVLASQCLRIFSRSKQCEYLGVVTAVPPHQGGSQATSVDRIFVDVGARSQAAVSLMGIRVGDPVVPATSFTPFGPEDLFIGKAFDNRAGMTVLSLAVNALDELPSLPCNLIAVATVQEEVGCRGAATAAELTKPDVVIVLEGPPADDVPGLGGGSQGVLGRGVQIRAYDPTAIMNPRLVDLALKVADDMDIRCQLAVRRTGGTDARAFQAYGAGVPVVVLGVPARYIHTHNAVLDMADLKACLDLAVGLVRALDGAQVGSLTKYL
jgi:endoglucanase